MKKKTVLGLLCVAFCTNFAGCNAHDIAKDIYNDEVPENVAQVTQAVQQTVQEGELEALEGVLSLVEKADNAFNVTPTPTESTVPAPEQEMPVPAEPTQEAQNGELAVHFIDVGQGDAVLISFKGEDGKQEYAMIDCGDNDKGTAVQKYLMDMGVDELKYLILTHPDADHIGGADVVITKFNVDNILMSSIAKDTRTYEDVINAISYRGYENITRTPEKGEKMMLGDAEFTIMASPTEDYGDVNNASIVVKVEYGSIGYLFMGDAEYEEEMDLIEMYQGTAELDTDILKVGHHGSKTSSNEEILDMITPMYGVISCGEGNSYHHPHKTALTNLQETGLELFRTDEQGSIISFTDGYHIEWVTEQDVKADWNRGADASDIINHQLLNDDFEQEI